MEKLQQTQDVFPLATLAGQMGELPEVAQEAAFESMLQTHRRLQAQHHWRSLEVLCIGCLALPRAQWRQALDGVLDELALLSGDVRGSGVLGLARKFCLAEPAANGPIGPPQPDNPRLDIRLQCLDKVLASMPPLLHPPPKFLEAVNDLHIRVEHRLMQRPDDTPFLTEVLHRIRWLRGD
jgi:hypothetical protein